MKTSRRIRQTMMGIIVILSLVVLILGAALYVFVEIIPKSSRWTPDQLSKHPFSVDIPVHYEIDMGMQPIFKHVEKMRVTVYSNRVEETDTTPNLTAGDRLVYEGSVAISQDYFNIEARPGDLLYISKLEKYFVIEDTMNKRYTNSCDIFYYKRRLRDKSIPKMFNEPFVSDAYIIRVPHTPVKKK